MSSNALVKFEFESDELRVVVKDGDPWFVVSDVAKILNFRDAATAIRCVDEEDRHTHSVCTSTGEKRVLIISESGLYTLLLRSDKPEAKPFRKWVTSEVLPSIRKTGQYDITQKALPKNYIEALEALVVAEKEKLALTEANEEMQPKADFYDAVADAKDLKDIGEVAKTLAMPGKGRNTIFSILRDRKILMKDNQPYQKYVDSQYFKTVEQIYHRGDDEAVFVNLKTMVTQKGIEFIRRILLESEE